MAPNPKQCLPNHEEHLIFHKPESDLTGEEIVISGISGIFPKSDCVEAFMNNLYNKVNMVTNHEQQWPFVHPEMPKHSGQVKGFDMFDAQFHKVPHGQVELMDPMSRKLMENAYGALFDAGVNPNSLAGTNLGVFVGSSYTDISNVNLYNMCDDSKYMITGCSKAMQANRISYALDGKGPSFSADASDSSTMMSLEQAFWSLKSGRCSSAIVAGANQLLEPMLTFNLRRAGLLCLDGKTKCFDQNADGYVRSEAVSVLFLQRASGAKRIYAEIVYMKHKYLKPDMYFLPVLNADDLEEFLHQFYLEANISPNDVEYVEACGSGIAQGDKNELEAINRIFANGKSIKIGCVKSNMGHSEGASDGCSITKVCLAYHKGKLPGNLHYNVHHDSVAAVRDNRIQVITENVPFKRGYTAFSSFSNTGLTYHALMNGHYKKKQLDRYASPMPRLVLASGIIDRSVSKIFDALKNQPVDAEQIALLHDFFANDITGHTFKGYIILDTNEKQETVTLAENIKHNSSAVGPIWFLYSGMGSQWTGMGTALLQIPTFAASIERCRKVLLPKGIDIVKIIVNENKDVFDNILHSFVGITAIQIGLTDLLKEMGIVPDNIIGHSLGEHGCAYVDGCFTAEETILVSYYRGLISIETKFINGAMAAVGLGYEQIASICPPEVEVACHNSSMSSTISGPAEIVAKFVEDLKSQGIFAKEVQTSNIAYHSSYIAKAGPRLLSSLSEIIKAPKLRSEKWLCTSAPPANWHFEDVKYASAKYFTNNLLSSVYFDEAARNIPENSTIIEIAPHGLMQAILRRSHSTCTNIPLTKQNNSSPINFLLEAVGKLYQEGLNPKIDFLYPKVQYPVSTETPLLSQLIEWAHDNNWKLSAFKKPQPKRQTSRNFAITLYDDDWQYLQGHIRNGTITFPESAFLVLVWETLAMHLGLHYTNISVIFENIRFDKELYLKNNDMIKFTIGLQVGNSRFEICQDGVKIACGTVYHVKKSQRKCVIIKNGDINDDVVLTMKQIYMVLGVKGYSYKDEFQSIISADIKYDKASIKWTNEWVTFLDALMQFSILSKNHDGVSIPKLITRLSIDTKIHEQTDHILVDDVICLNATYNDTRIKCGGVEIDGVEFHNKPIVDKISDVDKLSFIPHVCPDVMSVNNALKINMQIVAENVAGRHLKITELMTDYHTNTLSNEIKDICQTMLNIEVDINCMEIKTSNIKDLILRNEDLNNVNIFVIHNYSEDTKKIFDYIDSSTFILSIIPDNSFDDVQDVKLITRIKVDMQNIMILRKQAPRSNVSYIVVDEKNNISWMSNAKTVMQKGEKVVLISEKYQYELINIVKNLQKEGFDNIRLVMVKDYPTRKFNVQSDFYTKQIEKDLVFNIFQKGHWGGYYYLPADIPSVENLNISLTNRPFSNFEPLTWIENSINPYNKNLIQVIYAGPSLYDYQNVIGKVNGKKSYGMDFSGYNFRAEKVMGLVSEGALASTVEADPVLLWPVPKYWSMQDAATVPLPYAMAYYCLAIRGSLKRDYTVLVIGGAGALGQAVISICLAADCTVFTTVSNNEKKHFLLKLFPKLHAEFVICTSDSTSLHGLIAFHTKKSLCNYVISCATGDLRQEAMQCVGSFGEFMNVNNHDEIENYDFGMSFCRAGRSYKAVDFVSLFKSKENHHQKKLIHQLISEGIAQGIVKPITRLIYSPSQISTAFKLLTSHKRTGRVLINLADIIDGENLKVLTRVSFSPEGSYLIIGCDSQLGVELTDRLIKRGVKNVVLHRKYNSLDSYINLRRQSWAKNDSFSMLTNRNLQKYEECNSLLSECETLGPVLGIFITHDGISSCHEEIKAVVSNLDKVSRNKCHQLSNFVIISDCKRIGGKDIEISAIEQICGIRNEDKLPSLVLYTDAIYKQTGDNLAERFSKLFHALEISIKYKYSNVMVRDSKSLDRHGFLNQITRILGALGDNSLEDNKCLKSLNINDFCFDEIRNLINRTFEIDYSKEELQQFTFARFKSICDDTNENKIEGLRAFYNFIEDDEIQASEPIVKIPSKVANCNTLTTQELDSKETYLIMVPGFEGHPRIFSSVGEILKVQAVSLQLSPDLEGNNIHEMAEVLHKHIKQTFEFKSKFYILGYSFGVNIALELAALLEKEGHLGVVYCLDSSPDSVRINLEAYLGNLTETALQNLILSEIFHLMTGNNSKALHEELKTHTDWSVKVKICLEKLKSQVIYSRDYQKAIIESIYKRIKLSREYEPTFKLESELVLMKGIPHSGAEKLTDDYNLSKYSKKPIRVFPIQADHLLAPYFCGVSNIVNKMLEPELLEKYKKMNLCEVYFE